MPQRPAKKSPSQESEVGLSALLGGTGEKARAGGNRGPEPKSLSAARNGDKAGRQPRQPRERKQRSWRMPWWIWAFIGLGVAGAVLSLVFSQDMVLSTRWVWAAVVGLVFAGAAWVLSALRGARKLPAILATVLAVAGIVAPIVTASVLVADANRAADATVADKDSEASGDGFDETTEASQYPIMVATAPPIGTELDVAGFRVAVTKVNLDATADLKKADPAAPAPEGRYVSAEVVLHNVSDAPLDPSLLLGFDLVAANKTVVDSTQCLATLEHPVLTAGPLEPGATTTVDVCFDVPKALDSAAALADTAVRVGNAEDPGLADGWWAVS